MAVGLTKDGVSMDEDYRHNWNVVKQETGQITMHPFTESGQDGSSSRRYEGIMLHGFRIAA